MCDGMFTSHVNAIINISADLKENCVCIHVNLFYTKLTIKRRLFKENKFFFCFFFAFPSYVSGVHHFWVRFLRM